MLPGQLSGRGFCVREHRWARLVELARFLPNW